MHRLQKVVGFTLVEMMITVSIMGIVASIAIPTFAGFKRSAMASEVFMGIGALYRAQAAYWAQEHQAGAGVTALAANHCTIVCWTTAEVPDDLPEGMGPLAFTLPLSDCDALGFSRGSDQSSRVVEFAGLPFNFSGGQPRCYDEATNNIPVYNNVAWFDFDGDSVMTLIAETIYLHDGELARLQRYSLGDSDDVP